MLAEVSPGKELNRRNAPRVWCPAGHGLAVARPGKLELTPTRKVGDIVG
jgi:hypothetical protein